MNRFHVYLAASAMALSGAALWADNPSVTVEPRSTITTSGQDLQQMGSTLADAKVTGEVQVLLSKCVNDGLTENHFEGLIMHLSKADRDRLGNFKGQNLDDLNRAITQFRADFKAKYNQDFDLRPDMLKDLMVYNGADKNSATVVLSESGFLGKDRVIRSDTTTVHSDKVVTETARVNEPIPAPTGNPAVDPTSSALGNRTSIDSVGDNSNSVVRGSEEPRATVAGTSTVQHEVVVPGSRATTTIVDKSGKPIAGGTLTLNLIRENAMAGWKINIPDEINGAQLKGNLIKHIQMLDDQKATWSDNASDCSRAAAFHVLQALNDSSLATER